MDHTDSELARNVDTLPFSLQELAEFLRAEGTNGPLAHDFKLGLRALLWERVQLQNRARSGGSEGL